MCCVFLVSLVSSANIVLDLLYLLYVPVRALTHYFILLTVSLRIVGGNSPLFNRRMLGAGPGGWGGSCRWRRWRTTCARWAWRAGRSWGRRWRRSQRSRTSPPSRSLSTSPGIFRYRRQFQLAQEILQVCTYRQPVLCIRIRIQWDRHHFGGFGSVFISTKCKTTTLLLLLLFSINIQYTYCPKYWIHTILFTVHTHY